MKLNSIVLPQWRKRAASGLPKGATAPKAPKAVAPKGDEPAVGLQSRASAIVASLKDCQDRRHAVAALFMVHKEALMPFAAMDALRKELTLTPQQYGPAKEDASFPVYTALPDGSLGVPRYYGFMKWGVPANDGRSMGAALAPACVFVGQLKDNPPQRRIVQDVERVLTSALGGAMVKVGCGVGKTVCALALIVQLGRRAVVLVNNQKTLEPQWVSRIRQFVPGARIGFLRQKKAQVHDCDIIVASIQSLMKREYDAAMLRTIGTVVVDECHHIGARMFSQAMRQLPARYTIGLSATPNRKDGMGAFVRWLMGPVVVVLPTCFKHISVLQYVYRQTKVRELPNCRSDLARVKMITMLTKDHARAVAALKLLRDCLACPHRTALVLSERVAQVDYFAAWCNQAAPEWHTARIHGNSPKEELEAANNGQARVIVATYSMANEALDIPRIDTVLLLSPLVGDMEQVLGRAIRIHDTKRRPLVLDIVDPVGCLDGSGWKRHRWYSEAAGMLRRVDYAPDADVLPSALFADMGVSDSEHRTALARINQQCRALTSTTTL